MKTAASKSAGRVRGVCALFLIGVLGVLLAAGDAPPPPVETASSTPVSPEGFIEDISQLPPPPAPREREAIDPSKYEPLPIPFVPEAEFEARRGPLGQAVRYDVRRGVEEVLGDHALPPSVLAIEQVLGGAGAQFGLDESRYRNFTELELVDDPDLFPWSVNCKLFFYKGASRYTASGVLIDPKHVLTAGHCVHEGDGGDWVTDMEVIPSYDSGDRPYGDAEGISLYSWTGWTEDSDFSHDMGLIELDRPIGALAGWHGYGHCSCSFYNQNTFHNPGYPAADGYTGCCMYYWYGDYDFCFEYQVGYFRDAHGGQSGSGSYHIHDYGRVVYAELSNSFEIGTRHVKINDTKFGHIRDTFIEPNVPDTWDLIPLDGQLGTGEVYAGGQVSDYSFMLLNYSEGSWSGEVEFGIYLSEDDNITGSDHLVATHTVDWSFSPYSRLRVNCSPFTIPEDISPRWYYIGVVLNVNDYYYYNNYIGEQDVRPLLVRCGNVGSVSSLSGSDGNYIDGVHLNWSSASGAVVYDLQRGTTSNFSQSQPVATGVGGTSWNDMSATPGTTYYYWVRGRNLCGNAGGWHGPETGWRGRDCNGTGTPDHMDIVYGESFDCNGNGVPDECDAAEGTSNDINNNGIPDECDLDCNANNVPDDYELADGGHDCNENGLLDDCEWQDPSGSVGQDMAGRARPVTPGVVYTGDTTSAAVDGRASCGGSDRSPDVWYRYVPEASGAATAALCGSVYDTVLSVHTGVPARESNEITCNDDSCGLQSQVTWDAAAGQVYWLRVSGFGGHSGAYELEITGPVALVESDCDGNGWLDSCDLAYGTADDCNGNDIPDICDLMVGDEQDCNGNGVPDDCDLLSGAAEDCNHNDIPDQCDAYDVAQSEARDLCVQAEPIGPDLVYLGVTDGAESDGSVTCGWASISPSVWYSYTPIADGTAEVSACLSLYDTVLSVHAGCPGTAANQIACNDDACGLQSIVTFDVVAGETYLIRIAGYSGAYGSFTITLSGPPCVEPTEHDCNNNGALDSCELAEATAFDCDGNGVLDDCDLAAGNAEDCDGNGVLDRCDLADPADSEAQDYCAAAQAACPDVTYYGSTIGAHRDGAASCGNARFSPEMWYYYEPAGDGTAVVSLAGSDYDTVLSVHSGCPGNLDNEIVCNDDYYGAQSRVTFAAVAGERYLIRVSGHAAATGNFVMSVEGPGCGSPTHGDCDGNGVPDYCDLVDGVFNDCNANGVPDPCELDAGTLTDCDGNGIPDACELADPADSTPADLCAAARRMAPGVVYEGTTVGRSVNGASSCGYSDVSPDAWFVYRPAEDGLARIETCGSGYDTVLAVHGGCPATVDNEVACNDDACGYQSEVVFEALAGMEYRVRISGYYGDQGTFVVVLDGPPSMEPVADCNENAQIDSCDIAEGISQDANGNGVPDECEFIVGDLNCDGVVNNFDIDAFVLALTDPAGYEASYPDCDRSLGDVNGDGLVNNFDIDPFVALLTGG